MLPLALSVVNGLPHSLTEAASECRMSKQVLVTQNTWTDGCKQAASYLCNHRLHSLSLCTDSNMLLLQVRGTSC